MQVDEKKEIGTAEVAESLGVTQARIRQLLLSGELQGRKLGRDWYVKVEEVERYKAMKR